MKYALGAYVISSLIPLLTSDAWYIRLFDFPRLEFLIIGLIISTLFAFFGKEKKMLKVIMLSLSMLGLGLDLYRILPYTVLWKKETIQTTKQNKNRNLSIITVNVLQFNEDHGKLLKLINEYNPDFILLLEVNTKWTDEVKSLEKIYPHRLLYPLENTYGLAFYSKLKLQEPKIRFLIEDDIPSLYTKAVLRSGEVFNVYGLHPRPPHYKTESTANRDAELVQVAKEVRKLKGPSIVMGDLNDVAWSHTTRLFRRISKHLDPRIGRGSYPTFPAHLPVFRYPLDYVFHSDHWTVDQLERLDDIGSDHFPMYLSFTYNPSKADEQEGVELEKGDMKEAAEIIEKSKTK